MREATRVSPPLSKSSFYPRFAPAYVIVLLGLFWWLAVSASTHWSQTSDELPHVTAGYAYDHFRDYRMHSENGNLPQRIFGLPPLLMDVKFPMDEVLWQRSVYWQLSWDFFYGLGNPTDRMLQWARGLNALFGVALGAFIYFVAQKWHGHPGGLLSLGFYVLCPNFLAHSALATSDIAGTLFLTLGAWFFWQHLARRDVISGAVAGLLGGLALVAKFNGILLIPIYALLAVADAFGRNDSTSRAGQRLLVNLGFCVAQAVAGWLVIWMFFGFRFAAQGPGLPELQTFAWSWEGMLSSLGWKAGVIRVALAAKFLPEAWLYGLTNVLAGAAARPAYFAGEYRLHGWWQFFPALFLTKTPLAMLGALTLTFVVAIFRWLKMGSIARRDAALLMAPVAITALVTGLVAITSSLNIGHRHILAIYPVLFIALGGLARETRYLPVALALLAGQAVESFAIRPNYLAFFNPLAGGPSKAYRLVTDSSIDWGQTLPGLHDWLAINRRPQEPVYLAYFGSAWPPHYGVRPTYFLPALNIVRPPLVPYEYIPGLYCVSATSLSEVYSSYRGPWRPEWEKQLHDPATSYEIFDQLRFSRLCKYLQRRAPDAEAGYAILIYRLSANDLSAALSGP